GRICTVEHDPRAGGCRKPEAQGERKQGEEGPPHRAEIGTWASPGRPSKEGQDGPSGLLRTRPVPGTLTFGRAWGVRKSSRWPRSRSSLQSLQAARARRRARPPKRAPPVTSTRTSAGARNVSRRAST